MSDKYNEQKESPTEGMIGIAEAVKRSGYSTSTIYRMVADGRLPAKRYPGRRDIWIDVADVDKLLQSEAIQPKVAVVGQEPNSELTVAQAARELGVASATVYRYVEDGSLPAHRLGRRSIRIKRSDLSKLINPIDRPTDPIREAAMRVVAAAPPMTEEQLNKIVGLLQPHVHETREFNGISMAEADRIAHQGGTGEAQ